MIKIKYLLIAVLLTVFSSCEKNEFEKSTIETINISSINTGQKYKIQVLLPNNYTMSKKYPTVYLLDGYYWFDQVGSEAIDLMSDTKIVDIILVSIEYTDYPFSIGNSSKIEELRMTDLTYPFDNGYGNNVGGGSLEFYEFLKAELIPEIENAYSVDTNSRTIMGHSLGGYFTLFEMMNYIDEPIFDNVVAISPSLWWADSNLIKMEQEIFDINKDLPFNLYMSMGSIEGVLMNSLFDELEYKLNTHNYPNLNFKIERSSTGHTNSAKIGFTNALKFLF